MRMSAMLFVQIIMLERTESAREAGSIRADAGADVVGAWMLGDI
jgi:hypothetical protein